MTPDTSKQKSVFKANSRIFMTSRIRLARNLLGHKFANSADSKELNEILDICSDSLSKVKKFKGGTYYKMSEVEPFGRELLVEDRVASKELIDAGEGKGVWVAKDKSASTMINEEDHVRIQVFGKGLSLSTLWRSANSLDDSVEEKLEFAFSPKYGYLTACPTNVGTGMRASVMMHLPALVFAEQMDKIIRGVNQLGMVVRGANGEGSESYGAIFQLSNQQTLGMSESDIVKKITKLAKRIAEFETNAREKLMQDNPLFIPDKVLRANAILRSCKMIDSDEACACLFNLRLAADMGLISGGDDLIDALDALAITIEPSHIQQRFKRYDVSADERDIMRAQLLNKEIATLVDISKLSK